MLFALALLPAGASAAASVPPRADLSDFVCHPAVNPLKRLVSVKATMRPRPGTRQMQLKFELLVTPDGSTTESVARGRDLNTWISPKNSTLGQVSGDVWNFDKSVSDLTAPAKSRLRVTFRWYGADGHVIKSVVRLSSRCHQLELRPDLLIVQPIISVADQPNQDHYDTQIYNAGATAAGQFIVQFKPPDGSSPQTYVVRGLDAGSYVTVPFTGPLCPVGSTFQIVADPKNWVLDLNRSNNTLTAPCPAAGTSGAASGSGGGGQPSTSTSAAPATLYLVKR